MPYLLTCDHVRHLAAAVACRDDTLSKKLQKLCKDGCLYYLYGRPTEVQPYLALSMSEVRKLAAHASGDPQASLASACEAGRITNQKRLYLFRRECDAGRV